MPYSDDATEGFLELALIGNTGPNAAGYERQSVKYGWATTRSERWSVVLLILSGRGPGLVSW
jgi:hypothetical protein